MRVLFDVSNLGLAHGSPDTRTGIFRATEFLLRELAHRGELDPWFTALDSFAAEVQLTRYDRSADLLGERLLHSWSPRGTDHRSAAGLIDELESAGEDTAEGRRIAAELALLNQLASPRGLDQHFDLYHSLKAPLSAAGRVDATARIVTVHDMVPTLFPELSTARFVREHEALLRSIDPARDWILCPSEATRADACGFLDLPPDRAFVTPLAADPGLFQPQTDAERVASTLARHGLRRNEYLLSLCTIEPRKNLPMLLEAFHAVTRREERRELRLALVGPTGWKSAPVFELLDSRPDLRERVVLTGYVPDEELRAVYTGALAFVYPSLYEGFGLPPLEAMQCGAPVITSSTSSLPEVVGDAGITVDPTDRGALESALARVLEEDGLVAELSRLGRERAAGFSWERTADVTLAAYREAVERS